MLEGTGEERLYLLDVSVQLEDLTLALHLSHADLAGELRDGQTAPLKAEGAVQWPLAATPDVVEGDLLEEEKRGHTHK